MPEFKTKITGVDKQTTAPKKTEVKEATFIATIMSANAGMTAGTPPAQKLMLEFQILHEDNEDKSREFAGRRVWQDWVTEAENPETADFLKYQLRLLLIAAGIKFTSTEDGACLFNTDHLVSKVMKITTLHKPKKGEDGKQKKDEFGNPMFFVNVKKVEAVAEVSADDII